MPLQAGGVGVLLIMAYTGRAPPERGTFFTLQAYERVGISRVEVYERVGTSVIKVFKRAFHYFPMEGL